MMGYIWFGIILIAFIVAAVTGSMGPMGGQALESAKASVTLAINLVGAMALFLGVMKVAQDAGLMRIIARLLKPVMIRLFPDVPAEHPAMGAMIMNMSANLLGLANAATPFGINAMRELNKLNRRKGTATNAMALFLAINTSNVTLLPTGVIAIRHAAGSTDASGIVISTFLATCCSTCIAILAAKLLQRLPIFRLPAASPGRGPVEDDGDTGDPDPTATEDTPDPAAAESDAHEAWWTLVSLAVLGTATLAVLGLVITMTLYGEGPLIRATEIVNPWIIPGIILVMLSYGVFIQLWDRRAGREPRLEVYSSFIEGAKDGFNVALKIIPYLVAILVAVGMFRASGALDLLVRGISPLTGPFGLPAEALPMALLRPLSGSGAYGYMAEVLNTSGPDTYLGYLVSTMQGSTETTFYVVAVYFGAVQVSRLRHTIPAALTADFTGVIAAVFICTILFGGIAGAGRAKSADERADGDVVITEIMVAPPTAGSAYREWFEVYVVNSLSLEECWIVRSPTSDPADAEQQDQIEGVGTVWAEQHLLFARDEVYVVGDEDDPDARAAVFTYDYFLSFSNIDPFYLFLVCDDVVLDSIAMDWSFFADDCEGNGCAAALRPDRYSTNDNDLLPDSWCLPPPELTFVNSAGDVASGTPGDPNECRVDIRPLPGEVVFTELMVDPQGTEQWFELTSTANHALRLEECELRHQPAPDPDEPGWTVLESAGGAPLHLQPGEIQVFARKTCLDAIPDAEEPPECRFDEVLYDDVVLVADAPGTLELACPSGDAESTNLVTIDSIAYDLTATDVEPGHSFQFLVEEPGRAAELNDDWSSWCPAAVAHCFQSAEDTGCEYGTPGAEGECLGEDEEEPDGCRCHVGVRERPASWATGGAPILILAAVGWWRRHRRGGGG